jgi:hypothetical protein
MINSEAVDDLSSGVVLWPEKHPVFPSSDCPSTVTIIEIEQDV